MRKFLTICLISTLIAPTFYQPRLKSDPTLANHNLRLQALFNIMIYKFIDNSYVLTLSDLSKFFAAYRTSAHKNLSILLEEMTNTIEKNPTYIDSARTFHIRLNYIVNTNLSDIHIRLIDSLQSRLTLLMSFEKVFEIDLYPPLEVLKEINSAMQPKAIRYILSHANNIDKTFIPTIQFANKNLYLEKLDYSDDEKTVLADKILQSTNITPELLACLLYLSPDKAYEWAFNTILNNQVLEPSYYECLLNFRDTDKCLNFFITIINSLESLKENKFAHIQKLITISNQEIHKWITLPYNPEINWFDSYLKLHDMAYDIIEDQKLINTLNTLLSLKDPKVVSLIIKYCSKILSSTNIESNKILIIKAINSLIKVNNTESIKLVIEYYSTLFKNNTHSLIMYDTLKSLFSINTPESNQFIYDNLESIISLISFTDSYSNILLDLVDIIENTPISIEIKTKIEDLLYRQYQNTLDKENIETKMLFSLCKIWKNTKYNNIAIEILKNIINTSEYFVDKNKAANVLKTFNSDNSLTEELKVIYLALYNQKCDDPIYDKLLIAIELNKLGDIPEEIKRFCYEILRSRNSKILYKIQAATALVNTDYSTETRSYLHDFLNNNIDEEGKKIDSQDQIDLIKIFETLGADQQQIRYFYYRLLQDEDTHPTDKKIAQEWINNHTKILDID